MKKWFISTRSSLARRFLSPGERAALARLLTELRISRHHREGLRGIRRKAWPLPMRLNLGCGSERKEGYLNVDLFPGGDLTLDLRRGLPFETASCASIFSEHFFEHVDYPEPARELFSECLRVLRAGGELRFSVPDTEWALLDYGRGADADYFRACIENSWWHPPYCTTRLEHINYHFRQGEEHRFAYDEETIRKVLEDVGFKNVSRSSYDPSVDAAHREIGSLFVTARKPA